MKCQDCKWCPKEFRKKKKFDARSIYCTYVATQLSSYHGEQRMRSTMDYLNHNSDCPYAEMRFWPSIIEYLGALHN
jgi:hypothetical protein